MDISKNVCLLFYKYDIISLAVASNIKLQKVLPLCTKLSVENLAKDITN